MRVFFATVSLLLLVAATAAGATPATRPLSTPEKTLVAAAVPAALDFRWYPYRPIGGADAPYCAMAAVSPSAGGLPVYVPFFAIVGPGPGPLSRARLVALGTAEPLAPLNLLIVEMCDGEGYNF